MKEIITNDYNLKEEDMTEVVRRVKLFIVNSNNEILLGYSHNEYQCPGGHVEENEDLISAINREMKEETGLDLLEIEPRGYIEWNEFGDNVRHLAMLFRSNKYKGEIKSSKEGEIFFIKEKDISKYLLSNDFEKIYQKLK